MTLISENLKQLSKMTKINHFSIVCAFFSETARFYIISIADMNSACKNTLIGAFL